MRPRRVLVVAADAAIRRHIRDNVFVSGYAAFEAGDRRSALAAAEDFSPHVAIVDLRPPRSTQTTAELPSEQKHSAIETDLISAMIQACTSRPMIIAVSGGTGSSQPSTVMQAGADDYLVDPFCIGELLVRVDRLLGVALPPPRNEIRPREQPRLSDLLDDTEHMTLAWITLGGLEQLEAVGIDGHVWVAQALAPVIESALPGASVYWAGTERIAAIGPAVQSGADLSSELAENAAKAIAEISLPLELKLKVRAGIRAWSEGKATFIARVTGRLSHGGLPAVPIADGRPATTTAEAVRSKLNSRLVQRELGGLTKHK